MAAITFVVMAFPPQHTADNQAGKYQRGDIVSAYLTKDVPEAPHPNSRFVFVDVPDVPNNIALKIKRVLDGDRDSQTEDVINRRTWYLDRDLIPPTRLSNLIATRRGSASWAEFKNIVKRRMNESNITEVDFD